MNITYSDLIKTMVENKMSVSKPGCDWMIGLSTDSDGIDLMPLHKERKDARSDVAMAHHLFSKYDNVSIRLWKGREFVILDEMEAICRKYDHMKKAG